MNAIFKGKTYGAVTVGERGQLVIPADLRKEFNIKSGSKLMVFGHPERKYIAMMSEKDFTNFLGKAAEVIAKLESGVQKKGK